MGKLIMDTIATPTTPNEGDSALYFDETSKTLKSVDDEGDVTEYLSTTTTANFPAKQVHVSSDGSDTSGTGGTDRPYATIEYAVSTITDSSSVNPYVIIVHPGVYVENNPIAVPNKVDIVGVSVSSCIISAANSSSKLFTLSDTNTLENLVLSGPSNECCICTTGTGFCLVRTVICGDALYGIELNQTSGGTTTLVSGIFDTCSIGLRSLGEENITLALCEFVDCGTDISISNSDATIITSAIKSDRDKISLPDQYDNFYGQFNDTKTGDEALLLYSELSVGRPEQGKESCFGEGDSYTRGMLAYTYNSGTTSYTNVTSDLTEPDDGNTVSFPGVGVDNAIYVGSTLKDKNSSLIRHLGHKLLVTGAAVGGDILLEYYNGSNWVEFGNMGVKSSDNYITYGKQFLYTINSYQVRFDDSIGTNWTSNDPIGLGTSYYWVRYRIDTEITTSPILEQVKLHSNRTEINDDGYLEYFGKARPISTLPIIYGSFQSATESPGNQDIFISDNIGVGMIENDFANGATDRTGLAFYMPLDIDTSCPVRLRISYFGTSAGVDTVDWVVRWGYTSPGDSIYSSVADAPTTGPNEESLSRSTAMPTSEETLQSEVFELDVSGIVSERINSESGDILWITIQRTGGDDTYSGDVIMVSISPYYTKWRDGGHIENLL